MGGWRGNVQESHGWRGGEGGGAMRAELTWLERGR